MKVHVAVRYPDGTPSTIVILEGPNVIVFMDYYDSEGLVGLVPLGFHTFSGCVDGDWLIMQRQFEFPNEIPAFLEQLPAVIAQSRGKWLFPPTNPASGA